MHNVNTDALDGTIAKAQQDLSALKQHVDMTRALGVTDDPPVQRVDWHLEVDADAPREKLEELKRIADEHCPGVYCLRNPIKLSTHLIA